MSTRIAFCLVCLLVSGEAFAQFPDAKVSYTTVAVPASQAIADLKKITHLDLGIRDPLGSEPVILRLKDAPLGDAMARLAQVLHGQWQKQGPVYTLWRSAEMDEELAQQPRDERLAQIRKHMSEFSKYRSQEPLTMDGAVAYLKQEALRQAQEEERYRKMEEEGATGVFPPPHEEEYKPPTPEEIKAETARHEQDLRNFHYSADGRLMDRILDAIDPSILASETSIPLVFSTEPKPLQFKLDISEEELDEIYEEQNLWTTAQKGSVDPSRLGFWNARHLIDPRRARVVAIYGGRGEGPGSLKIYIVDEKGRQLVAAENPGLFEDRSGLFEYPNFESLKIPAIHVSPLAKEYSALLNGMEESGVDAVRAPSASLMDFLLNPEKHDPLSLRISEVLVGIAEAKDWNMVARVPDEAAVRNFGAPDPIDGEQFLAILSYSGVSIKAENGWLVALPKVPVEAEAERSSRAAMGQFLRATLADGYASLENMSEYAAANGLHTDEQLVLEILRVCAPRIESFQSLDWATLRFLGLLDPQQKASMSNGQGLPMTAFGPEQLECLRTLTLAPSGMSSDGDFEGWEGGDVSTMFADVSDGGETDTGDSSPAASAPSEDEAAPTPGSQDEASSTSEVPAPDEEEPMEDALTFEPTEMVLAFPDPKTMVSLKLVPGTGLRVREIPSLNSDPNEKPDSPAVFWGREPPKYPTESWSSVWQEGMRRPRAGQLLYATAPMQTMYLKLHLGGQMFASSALTEYRKLVAPFGPLESLPKEMQDAIIRGRKQRESFRSMFPSPGGNKPPEPAPSAPPPPN